MDSLAVLYIITAVISIAVALLLANFARLSSQAKSSSEKKAAAPLTRRIEAHLDEQFKNTLSKKLSEFVDSKQLREHIARSVTEIVGKELEKKLEQASRELSTKYETIIHENAKSEEVVWQKYTKVLGDKKQTDAVIRSVAEGLVVVDAAGKVLMINPAAEKLLGTTAKEKIGKPISEGVREEQLISLVRPSSDDEEHKEIEFYSKEDETKKVLRASTAVIENENGNTMGMVSVLSDITKQKELDNLKANFVANVSHELRTPLVAIEKSVSLILSKATGQLSDTQEQFLSIAERNLKRLSLLINDLLDLSKLEAGKMALQREPSSIKDLIKESADSLATWAKTKSLLIEEHIQQDLPSLNIDPNKIIQVMNNLIGNAIKFTPQNGRISIRAALTANSKHVEVSVADSGIGIAKENLPKLFDKFYQVGERVATDIGGTGIGLAICKEIAELHGGRVWAESEKNQGARFIFTLPV